MTQYLWERPDWTHFRWRNYSIIRVLGESRLLQGKLLGQVTGLGLNLESQTQVEILAEETRMTAAIEGENLDIKTIRSSVARKLGLPLAGLSADRYIDGLVSVLLDATRRHDAPLTEGRLLG